MTLRVTISKPHVYDDYGQLLVNGVTYTLEEDFAKSLIMSQRAIDTDSVFSDTFVQKPFGAALGPLEARVESLEESETDHEERIESLEGRIGHAEDAITEHDNRIHALEFPGEEPPEEDPFEILAPEALTETAQGAENPADFTTILALNDATAEARKATEDHFGLTVLFYSNLEDPEVHDSYSPPTGADDTPGVNRIVHQMSKLTVSWRGHEFPSAGVYNFTARNDGASGQNKLLHAQRLQDRGIKFFVNSGPNGHPDWYTGAGPDGDGYHLGPPNSVQAWRDWINEVLDTFVPYGMIGWEMLNEPESTNNDKGWWGTLGVAPSTNTMRRQAAQSVGPWVRILREEIDAYNLANDTELEVWGFGCQAMNNAGAVMMRPVANGIPGTVGLLNSPDGEGGVAADHLHRVSFHGYTVPYQAIWHSGASACPLTLIHQNLDTFLVEGGLNHLSLPRVDTECGVVSFRNNTSFNGERFTSSSPHTEWKDDDYPPRQHTGAQPPMTVEDRRERLLAHFAINTIWNCWTVWYAADEKEMGLYGSAHPGQWPEIPHGWVEGYQELEATYSWLRTKLLENNPYELRQRNADGVYQMLLGPDRASAVWVTLT